MNCPYCRSQISDHQESLLKQNYIIYCPSCGKEINPAQFQTDNNQKSKNSVFYKPQSNTLGNMMPPELTGKYGYFNRMNLMTVIFGTLHASIVALVLLMKLMPNLSDSSLTQTDFLRTLINGILPILIGVAIVLYDFFYASKKILNRDLKNYGIDFIFFGLLACIFGKMVGIYILIKGIFVMFIALTNSAVFSWRYKKKFGQVVSSFTHTFSSALGLLILAIMNPFLRPEGDIIYFFIALGVLTADLIFFKILQQKRKLTQMPLWMAMLKLIFGVLACFYYFAGIILVFEGILAVFVALFKQDWYIQ